MQFRDTEPRIPMPRPSLTTTLACAVVSTLICSAAGAAEQLRTLPSFIAVNCKGALSLVIEAGSAQSVWGSGDDQFVAEVKTEVVDNELQITLPDKSQKVSRNTHAIHITLPALSRVKVAGAGETLISKVNSDRLDISYMGAGHLQASGKVKYLRLAAKGVGEVNTKALLADRVDVNFEGIGEVSVYAHDLLYAVVQGMGS